MAQLPKLPTELIVEILSYLDYFTLNLKVRRVCRLFNDIISNPTGSLAEALFRHNQKWNVPYSATPIPKGVTAGIEKETMEDETGYYFFLHPLIPNLVLNVLSSDDNHNLSVDDVFIKQYYDSRNFPLNSSKVADEKALSRPVPASSFYDLDFRPWKCFVNIPKSFFRSTQSDTHNLTVKEFVALILKKDFRPSIALSYGLSYYGALEPALCRLIVGLDSDCTTMWAKKEPLEVKIERDHTTYNCTVLSKFGQEIASQEDDGQQSDRLYTFLYEEREPLP